MRETLLRLVAAIAVVVTGAGAASLVRRRKVADPPTQPARSIPAQLIRTDFGGISCGWLVVVFSSDSCSTCADVISKAEVLRSPDVAVEVVSFQSGRDLHERYAIDAVPCLVVVDRDGVVRAGFIGPVTAADLWAAVAEARQPGAIPETARCDRHPEEPSG